jgi:hypothetical protein
VISEVEYGVEKGVFLFSNINIISCVWQYFTHIMVLYNTTGMSHLKVLISLFNENISNTELWVKLYFCYWVRDRKLNQIHDKRTQKVYSTTNIMWYNNTYQPNNVWDVMHQTAIASWRRQISYTAHIQTLRQSLHSAILLHKIIFYQWITYQDISFQYRFINIVSKLLWLLLNSCTGES